MTKMTTTGTDDEDYDDINYYKDFVVTGADAALGIAITHSAYC